MWKINKFFRLSGFERHLFCEAVLWSVVVKLTMLILPFQRYASILGNPQKETPRKPVVAHRMLLKQIRIAIRRSSCYAPWETKCFVETISAKIMLRRRNIKSTIYLGIVKANSNMSAHSWIRCEDMILTGKRGMEKYTIVSTFG